MTMYFRRIKAKPVHSYILVYRFPFLHYYRLLHAPETPRRKEKKG